ncbi:uncharacterized protein LOC136080073 [Hydra vulgaris]|uniref:Uncharacterized protein LOC136080073 n=1 Tax=Hydra vulgaris TaxID=6087 RepID=A0ABM4BUA6_HYDVU
MDVGSVFNSFSELKQAILEYERSYFLSLYVRDSRTIDLAIKKGLKRYINKELKYYYLTYCCYHGGRQFKSRSKGILPNQSTYNIKCPFTICIGVSEDGEQLCVTKVINEHNHAIDKACGSLHNYFNVHSINIKDLKFPSKIHSRGRPKATQRKTAIGLCKRKRKCLSYTDKSVTEKIRVLLSSILI